MAQPTGSDIHIDTALSNLSIGYRNSGYIADQVFPLVRSDKQSDKYYIWTKDFWFRNYVQRRTPGDTYPEGALEVSNTNFFCNIFHLAYPINDEDVANQDAVIELETTGAEWLADQFLLNREAAIIADFFKTGVWGTDRTLAGGDRWSDLAQSDPIADVNTARQTVQKATGTLINTMVTGPETRDKLAEHPLLLDLYKHTSVPILDNGQIARALRVPRLLVGEAIENTAQEGATFSGGYMWGKNALFLHVPQSPGRRVASAGYTFVWPVDGGDLDVQISRVREDTRDREVLRGKHAFDQKATGTDLAYFLSTTLA